MLVLEWPGGGVGRTLCGKSRMKLSNEHLRTFEEQGFVVLENYYSEEKRVAIAAAVRKTLPPWEEIKENPPEGSRLMDDFPYADMFFNELIIDMDLISFVQRALDTEDIHFHYAHNWARYPNPEEPQSDLLHRDVVNCSLLPPCDDNRYGQISSWYFPDEVRADQAPMRIIPKPYGKDLTKKILLTVPAGTLMIFNNFLWHSATVYRGRQGQRYSVTRLYGRADHYWEGVSSYTNLGRVDHFKKFIGTLTARERQFFRFPPAGHPYYNSKTLELLEEQYPGWNARNEYV